MPTVSNEPGLLGGLFKLPISLIIFDANTLFLFDFVVVKLIQLHQQPESLTFATTKNRCFHLEQSPTQFSPQVPPCRMNAATKTQQFLTKQSNLESANDETIIAPTSSSVQVAVSVVVPCFNEEDAIENLADSLKQLDDQLGDRYVFEFILVDDGSSDQTLNTMRKVFAEWDDTQVIAHSRNQGIAAAIQTGIQHSSSEIVCSIDSDCTYDPMQLEQLLPLMQSDVAIVTASPYHPDGEVENVVRWRLLLSQSASLLYRCLFRSKLYTYTSCFRVHRKSAITPLQFSEPGFVGVAEMLLKVDRAGGRIVECPAILTTRKIGQSKLRIMQVIGGHLRLMLRSIFTE